MGLFARWDYSVCFVFLLVGLSPLQLLFTEQGLSATTFDFSKIGLPAKQEVAKDPQSFCKGFKAIASRSPQKFQSELAVLCTESQPSALMLNLFSNPYAGTGTPNIVNVQTVLMQASNGILASQMIVAHSMKVKKKPVQVLLGEESFAVKPFQSEAVAEGFLIQSKYEKPPQNLGESEASFSLSQRAVVDDNVAFDDTSLHTLMQYSLFPNNYDMMVSVRTLNKASQEFFHSVVLRGVIADPNDAQSSIVITLMHHQIKDHGFHEEMTAAFQSFMQRDFLRLYDHLK